MHTKRMTPKKRCQKPVESKPPRKRASDCPQSDLLYFSGSPVNASPRNEDIMIVWPMRWKEMKRT